ncbi:hypothetical protein [Geminocystis sp. GBBB08]|uniref:hypothetical protein n=1 Tax=Geminocystis sp. GBBB08 TaxID=2604140 RepID=UPI0027E379FF|nr:hypothetical protein [Geminocystis sp. GBBB08]
MIFRHPEPVRYMTRFAIPESLFNKINEIREKEQKPFAEICRDALELLLESK